nr:hypothetical protein [Haloarchaeobius amylolyticus]
MSAEQSHEAVGGTESDAREGIRGTVVGMAEQANPAFAVGVVVVPLLALAYAVEVAPLQHHIYVHVMAGVMWTGTDLFFGLVLGPVIGGLSESEKANVFERLTPKTGFLLPVLALTTIFGGITLAIREGWFPHSNAWLAVFTAVNLVPAVALIGWNFDALGDWRWQGWQAVVTVGSLAWVATSYQNLGTIPVPIALALAVVTILSVQGFGLLLPGEVRIYTEMRSANPDHEVVSRIGMRNARLSGLQGFFQLCLIAVMVWLSAGSFPLPF